MWRSLCWRASRFEDLRLHRHVEGGGGLVGEQDLGTAGERDRDRHPLAHAAGELVRVLAEALLGLGDADGLQQRERGGAGLGLVHVQVLDERLGDLALDLHHRVERGHRVLEDHRHLGAPDVAHLVLRVADDVGALVVDVAFAHDVLAGEQSHDRPGQDGLARAGLADDAEGPPPVELDRHAVDGAHRAPLGVEVGLEVDHLEQLVAAVGAPGRRAGHELATHRPPSFTSKYSRTRSPARFSDSTVRNSTKQGTSEIIGLVSSRPLPSLIMKPQVA